MVQLIFKLYLNLQFYFYFFSSLRSRKWYSFISAQVKAFPTDAPPQQHENLNMAYRSWHHGGHIVIFPRTKHGCKVIHVN